MVCAFASIVLETVTGSPVLEAFVWIGFALVVTDPVRRVPVPGRRPMTPCGYDGGGFDLGTPRPVLKRTGAIVPYVVRTRPRHRRMIGALTARARNGSPTTPRTPDDVSRSPRRSPCVTAMPMQPVRERVATMRRVCGHQEVCLDDLTGPSEVPDQPVSSVVFAVGSKFAEVVATPYTRRPSAF